MIRRYDLQPDGTVPNMQVHYNFYPGRSADGMSIDTQGNLYASAGLNQLARNLRNARYEGRRPRHLAGREVDQVHSDSRRHHHEQRLRRSRHENAVRDSRQDALQDTIRYRRYASITNT